MTLTAPGTGLEFALPPGRVAPGPAEWRGVARDGVRLMIVDRSTGRIEHTTFRMLGSHLAAGDLLVVNTSATLPAALGAVAVDGRRVAVHLAGATAEGLWTMEVRSREGEGGTRPGPDLAPQALRLAGGGVAHLLARSPRSPRLWVVALEGTGDVVRYLHRHGRPIRYAGGPAWPLRDHQTVFAGPPGSAEMPSAARPFTAGLVTGLVAAGVTILPVVLHTGLSSYEDHEIPGDERFEVPEPTARAVNALRAAGGRVVAVGTTTVRALETVSDPEGLLHPGAGTTDLVITPERGVRAVDGIITGWHEPRSSHLLLLEAVAGRKMLAAGYRQAIDRGYLWHEFGDAAMIVRR